MQSNNMEEEQSYEQTDAKKTMRKLLNGSNGWIFLNEDQEMTLMFETKEELLKKLKKLIDEEEIQLSDKMRIFKIDSEYKLGLDLKPVNV
jgi:hypothetical protein